MAKTSFRKFKRGYVNYGSLTIIFWNERTIYAKQGEFNRWKIDRFCTDKQGEFKRWKALKERIKRFPIKDLTQLNQIALKYGFVPQGAWGFPQITDLEEIKWKKRK